MGWLLDATGIAGLMSTLVVGAMVASVHQGAEIPAAVAWVSNWIWIPAQLAVFELLLRFPTGRLPGPAGRAFEALIVGWRAWSVTITALVPGPLGFGFRLWRSRIPQGRNSQPQAPRALRRHGFPCW